MATFNRGLSTSSPTSASIEPLVTTTELARILGCATQTIINSRVRGGHALFDKGFLPLGVKAGLRWRPGDVRDYIDKLASRDRR